MGLVARDEMRAYYFLPTDEVRNLSKEAIKLGFPCWKLYVLSPSFVFAPLNPHIIWLQSMFMLHRC